MGKLLVVGSVALDSVKTPFGEVTDALGGSGTFFCTAASYFTDVQLVAVVGEDFPQQHLAVMQRERVDLDGLERRPGRTFRWRGEYSHKLNEAKTLDTQLNVLETFHPTVPESYRRPSQLFLANIDPDLQSMVLGCIIWGNEGLNFRFHLGHICWRTGCCIRPRIRGGLSTWSRVRGRPTCPHACRNRCDTPHRFAMVPPQPGENRIRNRLCRGDRFKLGRQLIET